MFKIVVIDDEYIVVEGMKAMIARAGLNYEIVGAAYDGITAFEVIRETKPDIVITDIRIPGMDGLSLIEEVKELLPDTVCIVISGYNEFEYARKALSLGVKGYIEKPITIEKITQVLSKLEKERDVNLKKQEHAMTADHQRLDQHMQNLISSIMQSDVSNIKRWAEEIHTCMGQQYKDLEIYKSEYFKLLCAVTGVFQERRKQYERTDMVSYLEIERFSTFEEIDIYVDKIINNICEKVETMKYGSTHRTILQILTYISEHYDVDIGLNELADMVKMNPAYLSILFKEEVGTTYIKYLTSVRMNHAREYLLNGHKVADVSKMVGYNNYRYFCDIFKKNVGVTPNEFKGNIRKKL